MFKHIKWAYQRATRGYDDTFMWGLDSSFEVFIEPIEQFCKEELADTEIMTLNPKKKKIFELTLRYIQLHRADESVTQDSTPILWEHIGKNIQAFWN